jgi:predicted RNA-binding Zn-ribbon protein involved in translation (DUF1610 family)
MPKKPVPLPVADRPNYPSLQDATERALEAQKRGPGEYGAYISCPNCSEELITARPPLMPTAFEGKQYLKCPSCGWNGSIPTGGGY